MELLKQLTRLCPPYMHLYISTVQKLRHLCEILKQESEPGTLVILIDGGRCRTPEELYNEFAKAFAFPSYFGHNWAALDECLNDLSWLPAKAYILVIKDFNNLLPDSLEDKKILIDIVVKTAVAWVAGQQDNALTKDPTSFHSVLHARDHTEEMMHLLKQVGLKNDNNQTKRT